MVEDFAKYLSLNVWDWIAVSIAVFSLLVAVMSFLIAKKTLASQKQTEKNTMPVINLTIQEFLLTQLVVKLLDAYIKLTALWNIVVVKDYAYYPSEHIMLKLKIDNSIIHPELFYNNPDYYKVVEGFLEMINNFNINLDVLSQHITSENIENNMISNEFYSLISANNRIAEKWGKIMSIIFNYDSHQIALILNSLTEQYNNTSKRIKLKYYEPKNDVYLSLLDTQAQKNAMMLFLDKETSKHIKVFSQYLIKKIQ